MLAHWAVVAWSILACGGLGPDRAGRTEVLVPANAPRFAIGIVVPRGRIRASGIDAAGAIDTTDWPTGDGPMPAIRAVLKDPTITRSFVEGPLTGEPTAEGLRLGTVLVTLTTFDSIEGLPEAMRAAAASLHRAPSSETLRAPMPDTQAGAPREPYRHLLVITDRWTRDEATLASIRAARDEAIGRDATRPSSSHPIPPPNAATPAAPSPRVNQINAVAMRYSIANPVTRDDVRDNIADSKVTFTAVQFEKNLGLAAETVDYDPSSPTTTYLSPWVVGAGTGGFTPSPELVDLLQRMFARMTVCPSDFDRDGDSDATDSALFEDAYKNINPTPNPLHLYSEWNFDTEFDLNPTYGTSGDWAKFNAGFSSLTGCP